MLHRLILKVTKFQLPPLKPCMSNRVKLDSVLSDDDLRDLATVGQPEFGDFTWKIKNNQTDKDKQN